MIKAAYGCPGRHSSKSYTHVLSENVWFAWWVISRLELELLVRGKFTKRPIELLHSNQKVRQAG
jgi:hypothetical protein